MTLYIAVEGVAPEALDAADDELIAETVHQLLHEEVLIQDIETVGIVENIEDEFNRAVISENGLQRLVDDVSPSIVDDSVVTPEYRDRLSEAVDEAHNALQDTNTNND